MAVLGIFFIVSIVMAVVVGLLYLGYLTIKALNSVLYVKYYDLSVSIISTIGFSHIIYMLSKSNGYLSVETILMSMIGLGAGFLLIKKEVDLIVFQEMKCKDKDA